MSESTLSDRAEIPLQRPLEHHARGALVQRFAEIVVLLLAVFVPIVVVPLGDRFGTSDLMLPAITGILLFSRFRGRVEWSHWLLALFLASAAISLLQITDGRLQMKSSLKWIRLLGICAPFYLGVRMHVDERLLKKVGWGLFWGGLVAILISLAVWWLQIPIRDSQQKLWYRGSGAALRAGGLVGETTHFGHLTATWMTLSASLLVFANRVRQWRWVLAILLGFGLFAIFAASSRSAIINLVGTVIGVWLSFRFHPRSLSNVVIGAFAVLMLLVSSFVVLQIANRSGALPSSSRIGHQIDRFLPSESNSVNRFSSGRLESWERYLRLANKHILLGCGYKNSPSLIPGRVPDNSILSVLLETGTVGLSLMVAFVGSLLLVLFHCGRKGNPYAVLLTGVWCGQAMQALLGDTYTLWLSMPVLYLVTGLVIQYPREDEYT
ncbi:O-Antigen ligase [Roseimaritima multifibrata]|uniref:O-Antigen ligase n=1 Tax=Roseimaritima multifibrata TaxID=1930274 RepID=A0A517MK38_9BACT|nr:O-antigen ligase family protein [Roseimaritima multifibrata]QDS95147.1 O-Antigen ligase [Roseimaritima multifibrata]